MKIYGDSNSGNCLKVKWVCDRLALPYTWIAVDTLKGETRTTPFLKLNSAGQVPTVEFDDGRVAVLGTIQLRALCRCMPLPDGVSRQSLIGPRSRQDQARLRCAGTDGAPACRDEVSGRRRLLPRRRLAAGLYEAGA